MTKFILLALLVSMPLYAQETETTVPNDTPVISTEAFEDETNFNPYKSHWITTFGFEGLKYETIFDFRGDRKNFQPGERELWGGRIGVGGEIYLGAGINTATKIEGYYVGTLFSRVLNGGDEDESVEFAFTKQTGQVYGVEAVQSLGFMFDMKTKNPFLDEWSYLTVEPFIEAGLGYGRAYNRVNYQYDTGTSPTSARESYRLRVEDELVNARVGGGINFTSTSGYFFYMRAHVNSFDITKRKIEGFSQPNGSGKTPINETQKNAKIDPITTYALGGGYKF